MSDHARQLTALHLRPLYFADLELGPDDEAVTVFDWFDLVEKDSDHVADIYEYDVPLALQAKVKGGSWVPVAVIGLWGPARSFQEMGVRGTLFLDAARTTADDAPLLFVETDGADAAPCPLSLCQFVTALKKE